MGDLGTIITGNTPPRSRPELYGSHTPFVKATDISENEKYTYNPEEGYSEEGYKKYIKSLVPKGSTCVVTIGSIGKKMTMAHCDLFINQAMNAIIPFPNFDKDYVYYAVRNVLSNIKALDSGTASGRENVSKSAFSRMKVIIDDDLLIQKRIATTLSRYDSLIDNYQKQIKLLEEAAQRLYKEWFVNLRFPGHESTKIVDGVPEGWEKKKLGSIAPILTGKKDANYGTLDGNYPFFTCSQEPIKAPSYSFDAEAVLLAGNGDFNVKLYRGRFEAYQRTYVLIPSNADLLYVLYNSVAKNMVKLANGASGSTIKFLTKRMIENIDVLVPTNTILNEYNSLRRKIQQDLENIKSQLRLLTESRDRLLPKLLSGEIEV